VQDHADSENQVVVRCWLIKPVKELNVLVDVISGQATVSIFEEKQAMLICSAKKSAIVHRSDTGPKCREL